MLNSELNFCVDTLLVETIFTDPKLYKKGGFVSDLFSKVKQYFASEIDKKNPTTSVINMLAPGALWIMFQSIGLGKWGFFLGLLMDVFHIDVKGILQSLWTEVKKLVGDGKPVTSGQVDEITTSIAQEYSKPGTAQEAEEGFKKIEDKQTESQANDHKIYSSLELMQDAKIINLALIVYEKENMRLTKEGVSSSDFFRNYNTNKVKGTSFLVRIFGWIVKIALASAGLLVLAGAIRNFFGMDDKKEQSSSTTPASTTHTVQNKYPFRNDSPLPRQIPITNTPENIENMIIQFAKDVYSGLDGKENLIRRTAGFQVIKEKIIWANVYNPGSRTIIIPSIFTSKKQLVDYFIDDVADSDR